MTVLITGGSGFIGINLIERLLDEDISVVNYATLPVPEEAIKSIQERNANYYYMKGDVLDTELLDSTIKKFAIKSIIHAAVITPDLEREKKFSKDVTNVNYMGTIEVLEAARRHNIKKFLYLSSVSVYGDTAFKDEILEESSSVPLPRTLYEISKYSAERTVLRYKELFGLNTVVARIGQVFGPWEYYTGIRHTQSGPFQATRHAFLHQKVYLSRPGLRDWVYSRDVANVLLLLLLNSQLNYSVYHVGSGKSWTVKQWCELLKNEFHHFDYEVIHQLEQTNIDYFSPRDASKLSIKRIQTDLDYYPQYGILESFQDYMEWLNHTSLFWTAIKH
ncbi:NAD-dependent epimerase/dehydratase family protein [Bacillus weihaiensis]|uniref:NAD-dependent epimerase/dehydratase family protein n=1 Tax=Bacillus weihaiensis TaxID=1547283 RepID=UPI002356CBF1|nr:NAD(P)-dependent oxidoreductase [Bacillus weihaiensis]